jgi:hypothetical protein
LLEWRDAKCRDEKRLRLFDLYSGNLTALNPELRGIFFCPICAKAFAREAALGPTPAVNIVQVCPEASGGNPRLSIGA